MIPDTRRLELERHLLSALQQLFLDLSDAVLQPLLAELAEWQAGQLQGPSDAVLSSLQRLSGLAQDRQLNAIRGLSDALRQALVTARAGAIAPSPADCQQGAEELARLLFLYAAGQQRDADPDVSALLTI